MQNTTELPTTGFIRLPTVLSIIPISRANWLAGVKSGKFPSSYKLGRCTMWKVEDIQELIARISETGGDEEDK